MSSAVFRLGAVDNVKPTREPRRRPGGCYARTVLIRMAAVTAQWITALIAVAGVVAPLAAAGAAEPAPPPRPFVMQPTDASSSVHLTTLVMDFASHLEGGPSGPYFTVSPRVDLAIGQGFAAFLSMPAVAALRGAGL